MILRNIGLISRDSSPLEPAEAPIPTPAPGEVLVRVAVCGVCHTELDEIEGRTLPPALPIIPGHQAVGHIEELGDNVGELQVGDRVGIAWIHSACGACAYCLAGDENLCPDFQATGRDANGGYAQYLVAPAAYVFPIPERFTDVEAAPLLCAGAIGYRSLRLTNLHDGQKLGLTGFGASAHLVLKLARRLYPNSEVFVFARNPAERAFALDHGAVWAGDTSDTPPARLNAIIDTTPVWKPVVEALKNLAPGGRLVINAIRKEDVDKDYLLNIDYPTHLWEEKEIKSVANVSRRDVSEFLFLAAEIQIRPIVQEYPLGKANQALKDLKFEKVRGAKVLLID